MRKTLFQLSVVFYCLIFSASSFGSDFQSPLTTALGGAGHASPLFTDAIYLNPSFISLMPVSAFSMNYGLSSGPNGEHGHIINASILEGSRDSFVQFGLAYTRRDDSSLVHLALSKEIFERLSVGLGSKLVFPNQGLGPKFVDGMLSVSAIVTSWFRTALIIDNILGSSSNQGNQGNPGFQREYILGTKLNIFSVVQLYLDPHYFSSTTTSQGQWGYDAGMEVPFLENFSFRIGKFKNSYIPYAVKIANGFGTGLGWIGPNITISYAFSKVTDTASSFSHNFGFSVYF